MSAVELLEAALAVARYADDQLLLLDDAMAALACDDDGLPKYLAREERAIADLCRTAQARSGD